MLVIVLEGEDALIRPVLVGQEFAERIGIFDEGLLHRLEAIGFIDLLDHPEHALDAAHLVRPDIAKALGEPGLWPVVFIVGGHAEFLVNSEVGALLSDGLPGGNVR